MIQAVADTPETHDDTTADRQMILAMQALDHQTQVTKAKLTQVRKTWADRLKDATVAINERIRAPVPSTGCQAVLTEIQDGDAERQKLETKKSTELEGLKQEIAEAESAFYEILRRRSNPSQTNLNFGQVPADFDVRAGILLSTSHLSAVRTAAASFSEASEGQVDGMDDLMGRLDELGAADLQFPAEVGDDDDGDSDGDSE